jgi:hypothetical protein
VNAGGPHIGFRVVRGARTLAEQGRERTMLEDPGRFYWKWIAVGAGLLVVYFIEHGVRTGNFFAF